MLRPESAKVVRMLPRGGFQIPHKPVNSQDNWGEGYFNII